MTGDQRTMGPEGAGATGADVVGVRVDAAGAVSGVGSASVSGFAGDMPRAQLQM